MHTGVSGRIQRRYTTTTHSGHSQRRSKGVGEVTEICSGCCVLAITIKPQFYLKLNRDKTHPNTNLHTNCPCVIMAAAEASVIAQVPDVSVFEVLTEPGVVVEAAGGPVGGAAAAAAPAASAGAGAGAGSGPGAGGGAEGGSSEVNTILFATGTCLCLQLPEPRLLTFLSLNDWQMPLVGQPVLRSVDADGGGDYLLPDPATVATEAAAVSGAGTVARGGRESSFVLHVPADGLLDMDALFVAAGCDMRDRASGKAVGVGGVTPGASKVSHGLVTAGSAVAGALVAGAGYVGAGISRTGDYLRRKLPQKDTPTTVRPRTKKAVKGLSTVVATASTVSGVVVTGVTAAAHSLGKIVSDKLGSTSTVKKHSTARANLKHVALATLHAAGTVWDGMHTAALEVVKASASATHSVVEHRYGAEAGAVAADLGAVTVSSVKVGQNVSKIGVRALMMTTAKHAAVETMGKGAAKPGAAATTARVTTRPLPAAPSGVPGAVPGVPTMPAVHGPGPAPGVPVVPAVRHRPVPPARTSSRR